MRSNPLTGRKALAAVFLSAQEKRNVYIPHFMHAGLRIICSMLNNGAKEGTTLTEIDNIIFADGQQIENLKELSEIAADQHMRIIIYEDKVVMVRISSMNNTE